MGLKIQVSGFDRTLFLAGCSAGYWQQFPVALDEIEFPNIVLEEVASLIGGLELVMIEPAPTVEMGVGLELMVVEEATEVVPLNMASPTDVGEELEAM
jgi:hypothetical protein